MAGRMLRNVVVLAGLAALGAAVEARASFVPWGELVDDSWICFDPTDPKLAMHTANLGDYAVGFDQAKGNDSARGMNAFRFVYGGQGAGHIVTDAQADSIQLTAGGTKVYTDLIVLIAIDAADLPEGFSLSMGLEGETPHEFDPATDFGYYDGTAHDAGRPSGYYSVTDPQAEPLSYCFDAGMVGILAVGDLTWTNGHPVTIHYEFENLPGKAVFSLYGLVSGNEWIYHTNRSVPDGNDPSASVSTFTVLPEPSALVVLLVGSTVMLRRRRS